MQNRGLQDIQFFYATQNNTESSELPYLNTEFGDSGAPFLLFNKDITGIGGKNVCFCAIDDLRRMYETPDLYMDGTFWHRDYLHNFILYMVLLMGSSSNFPMCYYQVWRLPGGKYWNLSESQTSSFKNVPPTNMIGERDFAILVKSSMVITTKRTK